MEKLTIREFITRIHNKQIVIPNFQRQYEWSESDVCSLIGSIFYKLTMGSILLYQGEQLESNLPFLTFDSDQVRTNIQIIRDQNPMKPTHYVIDGQQRLTSLLLAFTDYFQETERRLHRLRRRYYFRISKKDLAEDSSEETDFLGLRNFEFKKPDVSKVDFDDFVENKIIAVPRSKNEENLDLKNYYYLPLDILYYPADDETSGARGTTIYDNINALATSWKKDKDLLGRDGTSTFSISEDVSFEEIDDKVRTWVISATRYIDGLLDEELPFIEVKKSLYEAIKTYEIMNTKGKDISDIDVIAARYAAHTKDDSEEEQERLYDRIRNGLSNAQEIPENMDEYNLFETTLQENHKEKEGNEWNFIRFLVDVEMKKDVPSRVQNQFIKMIKYLILKEKFETNYSAEDLLDCRRFRIEAYKSSSLLEMEGDMIDKHLQTALEAINWAGMFLQFKCGLPHINKLNYFWKLFVIAAFYAEFREDEPKGSLNREQMNGLIAWYFTRRFTGHYRIDQNIHAMEDLKGLVNDFKSNEHTFRDNLKETIEQLKYQQSEKNVENPFARKEKLLFERPTLIEPNHIIGDFFCEFGVRNGYTTELISTEDEGAQKRTVSTLLFPITTQMNHKLEKHHIFPVQANKTLKQDKYINLREDRNHVANSPLNMVFITKEENHKISSRIPTHYFQELHHTFIGDNCLEMHDDLQKTDANPDKEQENFKEILRKRYIKLFNQIPVQLTRLLN